MAVWLGWFLPETFLRCGRKKAAHLTKIVSGGGHYFIFFPFLTLYPFVSLNWRRFVQAAHTCAAFLRMEFGSRHPLHDPGGCGFSCLQLWLESTLSSGFDFFLPSPSSEESLYSVWEKNPKNTSPAGITVTYPFEDSQAKLRPVAVKAHHPTN